MEERLALLQKVLTPDLRKLVLSNPCQKDAPYRRINVDRRGEQYQCEKLTQKQAFHETLDFAALCAFVAQQFGAQFRQLNLWDSQFAREIKISKKGKLLTSRHALAAPPTERAAHDRQKQYLIREGDVPPLADMGVFTK